MSIENESAVSCAKCQSPNPPANRFCGKCGFSLDPLGSAVDAYLDVTLKTRIDEVLKGRFNDKDITETALAANVAERLSGWAKIFGFAVGVPITLMGVYLSVMGLNLRDSIKKATESMDLTQRQIEQNRETVRKVSDQITTAGRDVDKVASRLPELQRRIVVSTAQLDKLPAISSKLDTLEDKVTQLGLGPGVSVFTKSRNEGKPLGIDVSHINHSIEWPKLKLAGISFVFIKASQGMSYADPAFKENWDGSQKAGIVRGAYHFLTGGDGAAQARTFTQLFHRELNDLPPVVDFEAYPQGPSATTADLRTFAKIVKEATGCKPIIFSGHYIKELAITEDLSNLSQYPLWLAQFAQTPVVPHAWPSWTFWQFTDGLSINGLPAFDFSVFNGSSHNLAEFIRRNCRAQPGSAVRVEGR